MRIEQSALHMGATHTLVERRQRQEAPRAWAGPGSERSRSAVADTGAISAEAREALAASKTGDAAAADDLNNGPTDPKLLMLIAMVERMTGEQVRVYVPSSLEADAPTERAAKEIQEAASKREAAAARAAPSGSDEARGQQVDIAI